MDNASQIALKHSFSPHIGTSCAATLMLGMLGFISLKTGSFSPIFEFGWLPVFLLVCWIYISSRYEVSFSEISVTMRALGRPPITLPLDQITQVKQEASVERGRPFRRISIYGTDIDGHTGFVDVSTKHFVLSDIRSLLNCIADTRRDLSIPRI